jgi:hypothetical protein
MDGLLGNGMEAVAPAVRRGIHCRKEEKKSQLGSREEISKECTPCHSVHT